MYRSSLWSGRLLFFAFYCVLTITRTSAFLGNLATFRKYELKEKSILKVGSSLDKNKTFGQIKKVIRFNSLDIESTKGSPLAGRTVQVTENEDTTERVSKITLKVDGSLSLADDYDTTKAKEISGSWTDRGENKFAFLLNRHYVSETIGHLKEERTYIMERIYEGTYHLSSEGLSSITGEGKIEQEKYSDLFKCGSFSFFTIDDDDNFLKKTSGETHHSDPIGAEFD